MHPSYSAALTCRPHVSFRRKSKRLIDSHRAREYVESARTCKAECRVTKTLSKQNDPRASHHSRLWWNSAGCILRIWP
jgi:hypothetical protein